MKKWQVLLTMGALFSMASAANPVLESVLVQDAPKLDGVASEAFWTDAPALVVKTIEAAAPGSGNKSETTVRLKSVYTSDSVYFLAVWDDATYSIDRQRWVFDGNKWSKEDQTPLEKGGANTNYEDKIAFMWSINSPTYEKEGPWALYKDAKEAATAGYQRPVKTAPKGESLDMWHFKLVRNGFTMPGQVDDQFVNDAFDATKAPEAGRTSDPGGGGYYNNERDYKMSDGTTIKVPKYAMKNGDLNAFILTQEMIERGDAVEISDSDVMKFSKGTHLPAVIGRTFTGSRGDITGKAEWKDGKYTLEFGRKLDTGDAEHDVEFKDLSKTYFTGVATFDNTQIRHAVTDLIEFKFRR
jgi:hypothetical protein